MIRQHHQLNGYELERTLGDLQAQVLVIRSGDSGLRAQICGLRSGGSDLWAQVFGLKSGAQVWGLRFGGSGLGTPELKL